MNLLLIENSFDEVINHLNNNTDYIVFHQGQTYEQLLSEIDNKNANYSTVGIFSHGDQYQFKFVDNVFSNVENTNFNNFVTELKTKTQFYNLDLFSCFFGNNMNYIKALETQLNINIRASSNLTGNEPFGDWVMETDNIEIKNIYFNNSISQFSKTLVIEWVDYSHSSFLTSELKDGTNMVYSNLIGYAAITGDNKSITYWGNTASVTSFGLTLSNVTNKDFSKIYVTHKAFAAVKVNGEVYAWGDSGFGGTTPTDVNGDPITGVSKISGNYSSFAALTQEKTVVAWGDTISGGYTTPTTVPNLVNVVDIHANKLSFAAIKGTARELVCWGDPNQGGTTPTDVNGDPIIGVKKIFSTFHSFCCIKGENNELVAWGNFAFGGTTPIDVNGDPITGVTQVVSGQDTFACIKGPDNELVCWGNASSGGITPTLANGDPITGVSAIYASTFAFAAIKGPNKELVAWGYPGWGGTTPTDVNGDPITGVTKIYGNYSGFSAITEEKKVVTWGNNVAYPPTVSQGSYEKIYACKRSFAAITNEGKIEVWGNIVKPTLANGEEITGAKQMYTSEENYHVVLSDDSVIIFGGTAYNYPPPPTLRTVGGYDKTHLYADQVTDSSVLSDYPVFSGIPVTIEYSTENFDASNQDSINSLKRSIFGSGSEEEKAINEYIDIIADITNSNFTNFGNNFATVPTMLDFLGQEGEDVLANRHTSVINQINASGNFSADEKTSLLSAIEAIEFREQELINTFLDTDLTTSYGTYSNQIHYGTRYLDVKRRMKGSLQNKKERHSTFLRTVGVGNNVTTSTVIALTDDDRQTLFSVPITNQYQVLLAPFSNEDGKFYTTLSDLENKNVIFEANVGDDIIITNNDGSIITTLSLDQDGKVGTQSVGESISITDDTGSTLNINYTAKGSVILTGSAPPPPASSGGDPYVTTLCGNKFKLPNSIRTYRLVEQSVNDKDLIINASVSMLTKEEVDKLKLTASLYTKQEPVTDGYFYEKFFVSYGGKYAVFDRNINLIETNITPEIMKELNISIEYMKESRPFSCPIQGNSTSSDTVISVSDSVITLKRIDHPQIINGIEFYTSKNTDTVSGILNTYLHPRNYVIKKVNSTKKIKNKVNRVYNKSVPEKWITV